jgi:hypothetical protein
MFCHATAVRHNESFFDCSSTARSQQCFKNVTKDSQPASACHCLASTCRTNAALLEDQPSRCVLNCRELQSLPYAAAICPNYDDEQDWCYFYAAWRCVRAEESSCDKTKLVPSKCEAACEEQKGSSAADRLDGFLQCLGNCKEAALLVEM